MRYSPIPSFLFSTIGLPAVLLLALSACPPSTPAEVERERLEEAAQREQRARDQVPYMEFLGHKEANLCFMRLPANYATWGAQVPCTPEVCRLLIGERPAACGPSAPITTKAPTPSP